MPPPGGPKKRKKRSIGSCGLLSSSPSGFSGWLRRGVRCATRGRRGLNRELMFTTTGRSCLTIGASEGRGPACLTVSAVPGPCAFTSAAKRKSIAARRAKRRCIETSKASARMLEQRNALGISTSRARKSSPQAIARRERNPARRSVKRRASALIGTCLFGRGVAQLLQVEALALAVEHLHAGGVERVEEQPALGVGQASRRQSLVDLGDGEKAAADAPCEQGLSRLVRSADLQRRHRPSPILTPRRLVAARAPPLRVLVFPGEARPTR